MSHLLQHKVKQRLYDLSPRAFEFFAGDLLTFMGLAAVVVTRQTATVASTPAASWSAAASCACRPASR